MENKLNIVAILDKSGSMAGSEEHTVSSYNEFIQSQKSSLKHETDARVSLVLFDDGYQTLYESEDLSKVPELTVNQYKGERMGMTALYDAIGKAVNQTKGKAIVFIETDGHENSSKEFTGEKIKELIASKKSEGWEFVFVGSDLSKAESVDIARNFGLDANRVFSVSKTTQGYDSRTRAFAAATASYVAGMSLDAALEDAGDIKE